MFGTGMAQASPADKVTAESGMAVRSRADHLSDHSQPHAPHLSILFQHRLLSGPNILRSLLFSFINRTFTSWLETD
jgi:hypothetical protein